jgi:hypothetical protein
MHGGYSGIRAASKLEIAVGPLVFTGLALFGAAASIGVVAAASRPPTPGGMGASRPGVIGSVAMVAPVRRLAMILLAFAMGLGVLGVVVGILVVEGDVRIDPASIALVPGLALTGAAIGFAPVIRNRPDLDPWVVSKAALFATGQVVLAVVVAVLAGLIRETGAGRALPEVFLPLGLVSAAGAIGIGIVGAQSLRTLTGVDEPAATALLARAFPRIVPFEMAAVVSTVIAIVVLFAD